MDHLHEPIVKRLAWEVNVAARPSIISLWALNEICFSAEIALELPDFCSFLSDRRSVPLACPWRERDAVKSVASLNLLSLPVPSGSIHILSC
jgi:hypothetical protein